LKALNPCPAGPVPAGFFVLRERTGKSRGFTAIRTMLRGGNNTKLLK
jgi:hypothetical protein